MFERGRAYWAREFGARSETCPAKGKNYPVSVMGKEG
jgi:hypothetical protein